MVSSVNVHNVALQSRYFSPTIITRPSGLQTRALCVKPSIQVRRATVNTFSGKQLKMSYALTDPLKSRYTENHERETNEQRIMNEKQMSRES